MLSRIITSNFHKQWTHENIMCLYGLLPCSVGPSRDPQSPSPPKQKSAVSQQLAFFGNRQLETSALTSSVPVWNIFVCFWCDSPQWARASSCTKFFLNHTQWRTTVGRTPLDEWSARRRDPYLTTQTHTTDKHPRHRWDSNPQSQQASGRRPHGRWDRLFEAWLR
jgi:hypothetical protein